MVQLLLVAVPQPCVRPYIPKMYSTTIPKSTTAELLANTTRLPLTCPSLPPHHDTFTMPRLYRYSPRTQLRCYHLATPQELLYNCLTISRPLCCSYPTATLPLPQSALYHCCATSCHYYVAISGPLQGHWHSSTLLLAYHNSAFSGNKSTNVTIRPASQTASQSLSRSVGRSANQPSQSVSPSAS